jgi:hypothetical protein
MNEIAVHPDSAAKEAGPDAEAQFQLRAIQEWLSTPQSAQPADELSPLHSHLATLRTSSAAGLQRADLLNRIYLRSRAVLAQLMPALQELALPIPRKTRDMVRSMHGLLETLIDDMQTVPEALADTDSAGHARNIAVWRKLHALTQHLLISDLVASPSGAGIWGQLHRTYVAGRQLQLADYIPEGEASCLQHLYQAALLLGCAQPDSFTSGEISFIASYLQRFVNCVEPPGSSSPNNASAFWFDPLRDSPAVPCARKPAPPETAIRYFSCEPLAELINQQLAELSAGSSPLQANLPDFAGTPAGRGVLTRLAGYWGSPGKRRFPHRRRNHRAEVCAGLNKLWVLFQEDDAAPPEVSSWMITNQSPDGYAIMHVGGKIGKLAVGDIAAIRSECENGWQICLVRWALSENPEHLEMGLQILAPRAMPAIISLPSQVDGGERLPALLLPEIPLVRSTEVLVTASGALANQGSKIVLLVDRENIKVRQVRTTHIEEQTSSVEVFAITPDNSP